MKNNLRVFKNIKEKLTPTQKKLFESTCFGPWLQVQHPNGDPLLCHLILQGMIDDVPPKELAWHPSDMWFHFPPAYTRFGREEFCLVTGLRFGRHDTFSSYTKHIPKALWPEKVFTDLGNLKKVKVIDLKRSFDKLDFKKTNDIDVVRLCLLYAVDVGFLGRQDSQPISKDLLLLAENLDAWNLFPWGSYIWEITRKQLSTAIVKRPHVHQNGVKYTLSGFVWAFKIWILEAFPSMRSFTVKTSPDDIPRAISWRRKKLLNWTELVSHGTINDVANIPMQTLTPTEAEAATDWWQASQRFFDGTDDQDLNVVQDGDCVSDDSPPKNCEKSPYRDSSPFHRDQSPQKSLFSSSPSRKKQRIHLSPRSPPFQNGFEEINNLRDEVKELRDIVSPLQKEVLLLRDKVASLQEEVRVLHAERPGDILHDDHCYSEPDQPSALGVRRGSRIRHLGTAYKSPYTAPGPRAYQPSQASHAPVVSTLIPQKTSKSKSVVDKPPQKKKSNKCLVDKPPEKKPNRSPTVEVGEATHAQAPVSMPLQHQNKKKHQRLINKPPMVLPMLEPMWLSYKLPPSTIPPEGKLPVTVKDNSAWATSAVDFYLHERGQGCYVDLCRVKGTYLLLERSWWGILLGVESNGYLEDWHVDAWMTKLVIMRKRGNYGKVEERRWTIMPSSFSKVELELSLPSSYQYANGENGIHPKWWEINKVYIPICSHNHWFLVELGLPSLEAVAYDSMSGYISDGVLENLSTRWTNLLPKFLDNISYWKSSGNKKPKEFKITINRSKTVPQQAQLKRGDCGVFVCMWMERVARDMDFHLPGYLDKEAFGLFYRHYMAREIYARRILAEVQ